jgi:GNAT superfamily N-acetyltransferase
MQLIAEVQAEYVIRYGGPDRTPLDPLMFEPPEGSFFVGYVERDGVRSPVATGAWRRHDDVEAFGTRRTAEIKRMYVVPAVRARGLARVVLAHLERTAAASGAEAMILETGTAQPEAMALYESSGYTPIPSFGYYRDEPLNRCYAKPLPALLPGL